MKVELKKMHVEKLKVTSKQEEEPGFTTTISFEASGSPVDLARLLSMMKKGAPIYCIMGSDQAVMDLELREVKEEAKVAS